MVSKTQLTNNSKNNIFKDLKMFLLWFVFIKLIKHLPKKNYFEMVQIAPKRHLAHDSILDIGWKMGAEMGYFRCFS